MVKGRAKRVVVVESPDKGLFEQAIFIVGEETRGITAAQLVEEARRVAKDYTGAVHRRRSLPPAAWAAAGSLATGLVWLASLYW